MGSTVFVPNERPVHKRSHLHSRKRFLGNLIISPCLRPHDAFLPLMEGKFVFQNKSNNFAYVCGSGSWIVMRHTASEETDVVPQYFVPELDALTRTPKREIE